MNNFVVSLLDIQDEFTKGMWGGILLGSAATLVLVWWIYLFNMVRKLR